MATAAKIISNLKQMMDVYDDRGLIQYGDYSVEQVEDREYHIHYMVAPFEMMSDDITKDKYDTMCSKLHNYCRRTGQMLLDLDAANKVTVVEYVMAYKDGECEVRTAMTMY
jgi:hypothetical protein